MSLKIKSARYVYITRDGTEAPFDVPAQGPSRRLGLVGEYFPTLVITFDDGREAMIEASDLEMLIVDDIPLVPLGMFEFPEERGEYSVGRTQLTLHGHTGDPLIVKWARQFYADVVAQSFQPKVIYEEGHEIPN